jgi:hypothetical protein
MWHINSGLGVVPCSLPPPKVRALLARALSLGRFECDNQYATSLLCIPTPSPPSRSLTGTVVPVGPESATGSELRCSMCPGPRVGPWTGKTRIPWPFLCHGPSTKRPMMIHITAAYTRIPRAGILLSRAFSLPLSPYHSTVICPTGKPDNQFNMSAEKATAPKPAKPPSLSLGDSLSSMWPPKPRYTENNLPNLRGKVTLFSSRSPSTTWNLT